MKLAFIRRKYSAFGGAERFLESVLPHLAAEEELTITLLSEGWSGESLPDWLSWRRVRTLHLGSLARAMSFEHNSCLAVRDGGFDLVQSHERVPCCDLYRAGDGVHREWLQQRKRILSPLGWARVRANPFHRYLLGAERRLFASPRLKAVITNSKMVRAEILGYFGFPAERIHTIYSGVDLDRFHPGLRTHQKAVREREGIPSDLPLFLYLGSGFERKGLAMAIKALPACAWLAVVGKDKREPLYRSLAKRLGKEQRIRFLGPRRSVAPLYGAADAFVLPTLYDPFPNACFEAMAAGLPIITSTKSGAAELVDPGANGLICDALDLATLGRHMQALCDRELARKMGEAARATAELYPMQESARRMRDLYRSLLAS